jgi:hypothetical protein
MSPKPFLFISHSAKEKPAERLLKKLEKGLKQLGWDVFVDRTRLEPGALWREQLHSALAVCDAAVILFSRAAYNDSVWVLKEATIFEWRAALDPASLFPIVPVLFDEVTREDLGKERFKALTLGERLPVLASAKDVVQQVHKALGTPKVGCSPLERIQHAIAVRLKNVDVSDLKRASIHLGDTLRWSAGLDIRERFARDLFHADFPGVRRALMEIATFLDPGPIREIINLLVPFTVDAVAVAPIPNVALKRPRRARAVLAINSRLQETGDRYIQRARCHTDPWTVYSLANAGAHDQGGSLTTELLRAIRDQAPDIALLNDREIMDLIDAELEDGNPIFVLIHGYVDKAAVDALRAQFPSCTFLVLAGDECDEERLKAASVDLLMPRIDSQREKVIAQQIVMARQIAARREKQSA